MILLTLRKNWGLLLVLLGGYVLNRNVAQRLDIIATDDDNIFYNGLTMATTGLPPVQTSPFFSFWYAALHFFLQDPIQVYYLNWVLVSTLVGVGFYALLRSLQIGTALSGWLALFFLFFYLNFPLLPKVSLFALIIMLFGMAAAQVFGKTLLHKTLATALVMAVVSYVRPEFYVAFLLLAALSLFLFFKNRASANPTWLGLVFGIVLLLALVFGFPLGGGRSHIAFGQHFAMNYAVWHPEIPFSPWMHSEVFMKAAFGRQVTSVGDAFALNPNIFLKHLFTNISNLAAATLYNLKTLFWGSVYDSVHFGGRRYLIGGLFVGTMLLIDFPKSLRQVRQNFKDKGWFFGILLLVLAPTFISTILIFPREHYVVFHCIAYLTVAGLALDAVQWRALENLKQFKIPFLVILNILLLGLFLWPRYQNTVLKTPRPNYDLLRVVQDLKLSQPVNMLGTEPLTYYLYAGSNWNFVHLDQYYPKDFRKFTADKQINCIFVRAKMTQYFENDAGFADFIKNYDALGYIKKPGVLPSDAVYVAKKLK